jgi:hypothetical protein
MLIGKIELFKICKQIEFTFIMDIPKFKEFSLCIIDT